MSKESFKNPRPWELPPRLARPLALKAGSLEPLLRDLDAARRAHCRLLGMYGIGRLSDSQAPCRRQANGLAQLRGMDEGLLVAADHVSHDFAPGCLLFSKNHTAQ